jgi:hypothetical protein
METEDRPAPPPPAPGGTSRRAAVAAIAAALLLVVAVVAVFATRGDGDAAGSTTPEPPPSQTTTAAATTTTTIDTETEVVDRLREILRVRDDAYQQRDARLLRTIYTSDCPCLTGDGNAIRQLVKDKAIWVGASTSIQVSKIERVNERLWMVIAVFDASPFRIETESRELIRSIAGRSELFRFVLARSMARSEWLLGYAAPVRDSSP